MVPLHRHLICRNVADSVAVIAHNKAEVLRTRRVVRETTAFPASNAREGPRGKDRCQHPCDSRFMAPCWMGERVRRMVRTANHEPCRKEAIAHSNGFHRLEGTGAKPPFPRLAAISGAPSSLPRTSRDMAPAGSLLKQSTAGGNPVPNSSSPTKLCGDPGHLAPNAGR
jgi:hypothetical protein